MVTPIQKPAIMDAMRTHADQRGWVSIGTPDIARLTGIPSHDVVHAIWDFQKQGYVRFRERKVGGGGGSELLSLRLTSVGRKADVGDIIPALDMAAVATEVALPERYEPPRQRGRIVGPSIDAFPLIQALLDRRGKVEQAAALLEEAGEVELALAAMERAKTEYSPFEEEVVRLAHLTLDPEL